MPILLSIHRAHARIDEDGSMLYFAFALAAASGLFYHASGRDSGAWTRPLCTYGDVFCQHPSWLFYAAALSLLWGLFLKVDRI